MLSKIPRVLARIPSWFIRYFVLAILAVLLTANLIESSTQTSLSGSSYDTLIKKRFRAPPVDPSILILDIDEPSLAQMRGDFGRWPWPRETLASVLTYLERAGVEVVVFDILFADEDVLNPLSDLAFATAVGESKRSFFPVMRLDNSLDTTSQITAAMLPGFALYKPSVDSSRSSAGAKLSPSIAVIPPVFESVIQSGRLGYHNIYPDTDGVNRYYRLWEAVGDWQLQSLPARLAQALSWPLPEKADQLIQLPLKADAYPTVSFVDVWRASQLQVDDGTAVKVKDKIVIIGSTAPSLFDVKVTPLSPIQSGVQLLATAIDNTKNERFLKVLPPIAQWALGMCLLALMAYLSATLPMSILRWGILGMPLFLIGISYASLNVGELFIDLTGAASQAFVFFTSMTAYSAWRVQHFSTCSSAGEAGFVRTTAVVGGGQLSLPINSLIDHLTKLPCSFSVLQSGWTVGTTIAASGPACIFLYSDTTIDEATIRGALSLSEEKAPRVWLAEMEDTAMSTHHQEIDQTKFAWVCVGKALVEWDKS